MEVEYTISTGKRIFYGIFGAFLAGAAVVFLTLAQRNNNGIEIIAPVAIMLFLLAILVGGQIRKKVIISTEKVVGINVLQRKELPTSAIKGCRISTKTIIVEPTSPSDPKITINNYADFDDYEDLKKWFQENFKDLDATDLQDERDNLLNDASLGVTKAEREAKITRSKWIGWTYTAIGMFLGFISIPFDKKPLVIITLISYPLIGILVMALGNGLIKFISNTKRSVYSFTLLGIFMPAFVLCLTGSLGYDIYQYQNCLLPSVVVCLIFTALIYITGFNKDMPSVAGQVIGMLIISAAYAYGSIVQINCLFDKSAPREVHTTVNRKWKNYNKREHYYLGLNPFSTGQGEKDIEVSAATYDKYNAGDAIEVELKNGLLNIPWYYLRDEY